MAEKPAAWTWPSKASAMAAMAAAHVSVGAVAILIPCAPLEDESALARGTSRDGVVSAGGVSKAVQ